MSKYWKIISPSGHTAWDQTYKTDWTGRISQLILTILNGFDHFINCNRRFVPEQTTLNLQNHIYWIFYAWNAPNSSICQCANQSGIKASNEPSKSCINFKQCDQIWRIFVPLENFTSLFVWVYSIFGNIFGVSLMLLGKLSKF